MGYGWGIIDLDFFIRLHKASLIAYHSKLLKSEGILWIIYISYELVDLVLIEGVLDFIIELGNSTFLHLVEA